jgi:hypothetical protein
MRHVDSEEDISGPSVTAESAYSIAPPPSVSSTSEAHTHIPAGIPQTIAAPHVPVTPSVDIASVVARTVSPVVLSSTRPVPPTLGSSPLAVPHAVIPNQTLRTTLVVSPARSPTPAAPPISPAVVAAQALKDLNMSLLPGLHDMMEALRWTCPNHYMLGIEEPMEHRATTCSLGKCNNSDEGWKTWRKGLHFSDGCCYGCGVEGHVSFHFILLPSCANDVLQQTFTDELGETKMIHVEPMTARCPYSESLRAIAWLIYSTPSLRAAYGKSTWRNGAGLDYMPAVPFVRWLGLKDSFSGLSNLYTVGFFALSIRGQPAASTTFPMF